jgi:hypothetical protein
MTQEVIAGKDVVDLQALRAGIPLADVALEKPLVANEGASASIAEKALRRRASAGLAVRGIHRGLESTDGTRSGAARTSREYTIRV